jgi:DNA-binding NtrC family response regulator
MINILISEDDPLIQQVLKSLLEPNEISLFTTLEELLEKANPKFNPDLILVDLCHAGDPKGERSVAAIPELKRRYPCSEIVVQSGIQDIAIMRTCLEYGARKFILKDHISDEIPLLIERLKQEKLWREHVESLMIGKSPAMRDLKRDLLLLKTRGTAFDILVEGETGSGKELCARALHQPIKSNFVEVNAGAIPEDLFEMSFFGADKGSYTGAQQTRDGYFAEANGGTLFIDEIQNLSWKNQAKLLRVLETRTFQRVGSAQNQRFTGRIIFATNIHLREKVSQGIFREDLYYRIAQVKLPVPPLRLRREDIPLLAQSFLKTECQSPMKFTDRALAYLQESYDWPGNVRELRGLIRHFALKHPLPLIDVEDVDRALGDQWNNWTKDAVKTENSDGGFQIAWDKDFDDNIKTLEKFLLKKSLEKYGSREAREKLNISRSRFYDKLKEFELISD